MADPKDTVMVLEGADPCQAWNEETNSYCGGRLVLAEMASSGEGVIECEKCGHSFKVKAQTRT